MPDKIIYLDNASTTAVDEEILRAYEETKKEFFANPSSIHQEGRKSDRKLSEARDIILRVFNLSNTHEVIFTSGASEAINLTIKGYALRYQNRGKHIITTNIEHPATLEAINQLCTLFGFTCDILPVNEKGVVEIEQIKKAITNDTILVSIMAVNNEVGSINYIKDIANLLKDYPKIAFHVDATQAIGKINIDYHDVGFISYSGHKIHGLNGTGALIKNKKINIYPLINGGGQENGYRSGTNDVAGAYSLALATKKAFLQQNTSYTKVKILADYLKQYLNDNKELYEINSFDNPFIVNFSLRNKKASVVLEDLSNQNIFISSISACHSKNEQMSYVIKALNKDDNLSHNSLRVSLDKSNELDDIKTFIDRLEKSVKGIR